MHEDNYMDGSNMSGRIVSFWDFLAMEENTLSDYDLLIGAFVGKDDMNCRHVHPF